MGRRTILLIVAVVVAALGTSLVFLYVQRADDRATGKTAMVSVLYAGSDIPAGTPWSAISGGGLTYAQQVTADSAPSGAIGSADQVDQDAESTTKIFKGTPILAQQFEGTPDASDLGLGADQYGVSVSLGDPQRLANVLKPKQSVVLFTSDGKRLFGPIVTIQVVAIGSSSSPNGENQDQQANRALLTLALDTDQVGEVIAKAEDLYFALAPANLVSASNTAG